MAHVYTYVESEKWLDLIRYIFLLFQLALTTHTIFFSFRLVQSGAPTHMLRRHTHTDEHFQRDTNSPHEIPEPFLYPHCRSVHTLHAEAGKRHGVDGGA